MILTAEIEDFTMNYCRFGNGSRTFVLLPGLSTRPVTPLEPFIAAEYAAFTDEFTVYLFDRRNELPETYTTEEMAEDTVKVMRKLGISKICLCGASQGGMIALLIAENHPELVEKLIIASSSSRPNMTEREVVGRWIGLAEEGKGEDLIADMLEKVYSKAFRDANREAMQAAVVPLSREELDRFIRLAAPIADFDCYDRLSEIWCDSLVIGAAGDGVFTAQASRDIAEKLGCGLYLYGENYGHAAYDEAPDCAGRMFRFVSGKER